MYGDGSDMFDVHDIPTINYAPLGKNPSWWRRRTTLERTLTLVSIVALIAVIALIIGLIAVILTDKKKEAVELTGTAEALEGGPGTHLINNIPDQHTNEVTPKTNNVCLTAGCVHTASKVLEALDTSIEPCDDFYTFSCGSFLKNTNIPDEKTQVNTFSIIGDKLQQQLKSLISEEQHEDVAKPFKLANKLYKACMNKTIIEQRGTEPIVKIAEELGGWPVIKGDNWDEASWTWQDSVKNFRKYGFSMDYILDFSVGIDLKNSTKRVIDLDQSAIGLSREYLIKGFDDKLVQAYYNYMVDMAVIFGADRTRAEKELKESLQFEIDLATISLPNEKRRNSSALYNAMTIAEIQTRYPYVQWLEYINALLPEGLVVDENEIVIVSVPAFFKSLGDLLAKTPKRSIANYVMWRIHGFSAFFLTEELRKRQLKYSTIISGRTEQEPRWKECVDITTGRLLDQSIHSLPIAVGALYVRKYFKEDAKSSAMEMVHGIKKEFEKILTEVPWMDEQTRKSALNKLKQMATHIGYPDEIMEDSKIEEYYKDLEIDENDYLGSIMKMSVFGTNYSFNKLRKPFNKTDWLNHAKPAIVNAFYSSIENSIQFPAGILQEKFFAADRPKYMNYGAIGYVIGHEITHGFDDQGRQFDLDGNLVDWWQEDTKKAYLEKARCIIEQYGNYTEGLTTLKLNGINTQGENIADNGGIKESYLAYKLWAQKNGPEPSLPGLPYTPQQMFWISAAQTWCSVYRPETLKMRITTGVHSPAEFRVLGPMSNMKDFAKDFNCPEGTRMNPVKKCVVW